MRWVKKEVRAGAERIKTGFLFLPLLISEKQPKEVEGGYLTYETVHEVRWLSRETWRERFDGFAWRAVEWIVKFKNHEKENRKLH